MAMNKSAVRLDHLRHDLAQDHVLVDALHSGFLVLHGIASAAVQQSMCAPRGPVAEIAALDDGHIAAAQRQIVCGGYAGKSCPDDNYMRFTHSLSDMSP